MPADDAMESACKHCTCLLALQLSIGNEDSKQSKARPASHCWAVAEMHDLIFPDLDVSSRAQCWLRAIGFVTS